MKTNIPHSTVTNREQLRQAQRINKARLQVATARLNGSLQALQSSFTMSNMLLSVLNRGRGTLRLLTSLRRGYRIASKLFATLRNKFG